MFINKEETQLVVAIKNAILFNVPGSKIDQKKVANNARCNYVEIPAKLIRNLLL